VDGQPVNRWDERGSAFEHKYDALRMPMEIALSNDLVAPALSKVLVMKTEYGDFLTMTDRTA